MTSLSCTDRYAFGVGHVMNDLTAAMWFSYLLVFYHAVLGISEVNAGLIMLIGQVRRERGFSVLLFFSRS